MDRLTPELRRQWEVDGWCVVPAAFSGTELDAVVTELHQLYPTAEEYHAAPDSDVHRRLRSWDTEKPWFPFPGEALNRLAVHEDLLDLAEDLLDVSDVRLYQGMVSAKYSGGSEDQDQLLHVDYGNHTLVVPRTDPGYQQLEVFVFLSEVTEGTAPTRLVPRGRTAGIPVNRTHLDIAEYADLYREEITATGPAGSLLLYRPDVYHRGTRLTAAGAARFLLHLAYKPPHTDWLGYQSWPYGGEQLAWTQFVHGASVRQLAALGFPPPGSAYWTEDTLAGVGARYPGLDMAPWREEAGEGTASARVSAGQGTNR